MKPGVDNWRIKRGACSYYIPYLNLIATTGRPYNRYGISKEWTGKCIFKGIPQTSWFTCHECQGHQRSHWPISFCVDAASEQEINNTIYVPKPKKPRKRYNQFLSSFRGITINRIYEEQLLTKIQSNEV